MRNYPPCEFDDDPAGKLAEFAANIKYEDLSPEMIDRVKMALLDTVAIMVGGSGRPSSVATADYAKRWESQTGDGRVMVYGYKCPAPIAAVPNGAFGRALDYGDCGIVGGHLSEHIVSTLLSAMNLGDKPFTGKDFILAYCAGAEWGNRHHGAYNFHHHTTEMPAEMGWVQSTAALAKLMGLNKEQYWNAMGLSFTASSMSTNQKNNEGTEGARISHSFISTTGIISCMLAKAGMSGVHSIYFGEAAVMRHVLWDDVFPEYLTDGLGTRWTWNEDNMLTIKPYASCKFTHSCIYCAVKLRELHNINCADVADIHCIVSPSAGPVIYPSRWHPTSLGDAMYGLPYTVTQALMYGDVQLGDFAEEEFTRPDRVEMMQKVRVDIDPDREIFDGFTVELTMKDGTKYSYTDDGLPGSAMRPMTWEQLEAKYWKCVPFSVIPLSDKKLKNVVKQCKDLDNLMDLNELMDNLVP